MDFATRPLLSHFRLQGVSRPGKTNIISLPTADDFIIVSLFKSTASSRFQQLAGFAAAPVRTYAAHRFSESLAESAHRR